MIKIAIIDDMAEMCEMIKGYVQSAVSFEHNFEIDMYLSAEEFLGVVEQGKQYEVLYADIALDGMGGIELGKIVAEKCPKMLLVFITSYSQFAADSYLIDAYQYILKRDMEIRIPEITRRIIEKIHRERENYILIGTEAKCERISCDSIIYLNKAGKYVEYYTTSGDYKERITLNQAIDKLQGDSFVQIEKGIVVNMEHIMRVDGTTIYLERDHHVTVSRSRCTEVKRQINRYWGSRL